MARTPNPIDPTANALAAMAFDLNALREARGLKYRQMAAACGLAHSTLSTAANGVDLPNWTTVAAYVSVCGADPADWKERYELVAAETRAATSRPAPATDTTANQPTTTVPAVSLDAFRHDRSIVPITALHREPAPTPLNAPDAAAYVDCLRQVPIWAGKVSLREITRRNPRLPHTTMHAMLTRSTLPKWDMVAAFLKACTITDDDTLSTWAAAWHRIAQDEGKGGPSGSRPSAPNPADSPPAPMRLIPGSAG